MRGLLQRFSAGEKICLDTSILIYYFNRHEPYFDACQAIMRAIETGDLRAVVSTVTEMELLVEPLAQKRIDIVDAIEAFLRRLRWLEIVPVDSTLARRAASVRAETRLRSVDALVAATGLAAGCRYLLGNDGEFARRVRGFSYLLLKDYV
ncbi:MAG: type II toxin-antitoxin system VapC family toxin [Chloroflexi bacterium]|nr:type II toxin-antitoxin system VapC family toxin [Chloroflexota bacterium]